MHDQQEQKVDGTKRDTHRDKRPHWMATWAYHYDSAHHQQRGQQRYSQTWPLLAARRQVAEKVVGVLEPRMIDGVASPTMRQGGLSNNAGLVADPCRRRRRWWEPRPVPHCQILPNSAHKKIEAIRC